ncbi:MAG: anhydro-N-acetylmuramic acid kinase [Endozoicomonas sp.]
MSNYYIGLMSGTSLDALDAVLVECGDDNNIRQLYAVAHNLPRELRQQLVELTLPGDNEIEKLADAEPAFARESAKAVHQLLEVSGFKASEIEPIGSHGQTIRHRPEKGYTLQIGDPSLIAELTGITVVGDFRRRDVAAGGHGAPLVSALHKAVFSSVEENRIALNIGGISNITILSNQQVVSGFDTGPGNVLMDYWCSKHHQSPYDADGTWAASANPDQRLLAEFLKDPYFQLPPPKSTGRELFNPAWLGAILTDFQALEPAVVQATLCEFTARANANDILKHAPETRAVYVCGGGAYNKTLIQKLQGALRSIPVHTTAELGVEPDWVEAVAFAWFAKQALARQPANLPSVTGAKGSRILGAIYQA